MAVTLRLVIGMRVFAEPAFRSEAAVAGAARVALHAGATVTERHIQPALRGPVAGRVVVARAAAAAEREILIVLGRLRGLGVLRSALVAHGYLLVDVTARRRAR